MLQTTKHPDLVPYVVTLIFVVVGAVAVVWAQRRILARVAVRFDRDSLDFLTGQLLALPMSYFAKRKVGDIERRLQSMGQVRRIVVQGGIMAISSLALVLAVIVAMILEAPLLGVAFLVVLPLYGALMWVSRRRVRPIMAAMEEAMARYSASQVDLLKGVETVKTLGVEPGLRDRMRGEFDRLSQRLASAYNGFRHSTPPSRSSTSACMRSSSCWVPTPCVPATSPSGRSSRSSDWRCSSPLRFLG